MAIGASGLRIQVLGRVSGTAPSQALGTSRIIVRWQISEATIDGSPNDGTIAGEDGFDVDFEPTDSEIEAVLRSMLADLINSNFQPTDPVIATDVRGVKL